MTAAGMSWCSNPLFQKIIQRYLNISMIPFWANITNLDQNKGFVLIFVLLFGKHNFLPIFIQIYGQKIASYEVNCTIQFTKIICKENWRIFQKYMTHAMLIFYTCANFIFILEFDLRPCPLKWNQANT